MFYPARIQHGGDYRHGRALSWELRVEILRLCVFPNLNVAAYSVAVDVAPLVYAVVAVVELARSTTAQGSRDG